MTAEVVILPVVHVERTPAMCIGDNIKVARLARGMSLDDLSKKIGVSKQFICACEAGRKTPRSSVLVEIRNALGVTMDYLMSDEGTTVQTACRRELDRATAATQERLARARNELNEPRR